MTPNEWKKIARLLKQVYAKLEEEAVQNGINLLSPEYDQMVALARERVLEESGFTLQEYREMKDKIAGIDKVGTLQVMRDTQKKVDEANSRHIPSREEIAEIAHEVAKEYIKPPQIINQIVKETTVEKPTIVKETVVEEKTINVEYDEKPLLEKLSKLSKKVEEIKIEQPIDIEELKKDLKNQFSEMFEHNINILDMPNFRKLAMGLQGEIDSLRSGTGLTVGTTPISNGTNGKLLYDNSGKLGEATVGSGLSLSGGTLSFSGSSSATLYSVAQTGHGFSVGDVIKSSGSANAYAKAQADSAANAEVVGIVTVVTDADNFTFATEGVITTGVPTNTAGTVYFLSASSAGALTATEPSTVGQVSKPLLVVLESASKAYFHNFRGTVIASTPGLSGSVGITVDGQGGVITTGVKGYISIPYSGLITGWTLFADASGSCVIDTWKDTYTAFPPTVADTIWATKPTLSSQQKNTATGLSIAVTAGDVFAFNVDSATTVTRANLTIFITKQ